MSKFKVGDKVTGTKSHQRMYGIEYIISEIKNDFCGTRYRLKNFGDSWWWDEELRLLEKAKTEFTFEEVIAMIKEGEVYENGASSIAKVDGCIEILISNNGDKDIPKGGKFVIGFDGPNYRLVPQKKEYNLYEVEHQEDGKRYLFRSDLDHTLDDMVVCDTCHGKSYGKMVKVVTKELTEEEYKQYKPIVKIISKGCPF